MFKPRRYGISDNKHGILDNSYTAHIGEVVIPGVTSATSVVKTGGSTTGLLLGVIMGFKDPAGLSLEDATYAAASNNVTVNKVRADYVPFFYNTEFLTDLDAVAETTTGSGEFGNFAVDSTGLLAHEASYVAFGTRSAVQMFSYGLTGNPMDTKEIAVTFFATVAGAQT